MIPEKVKRRFWSKVRKTKTCWIWKGGKGSHGYGDFYLQHISKGQLHAPAHRVSWMIHYGPIPKGKFICHHCDVKLCVNPKHIYLGTPSTNMYDSWKRGDRSHVAFLRGENHPSHKLSLKDVKQIKKIFKSKRALMEVLAEKFKVSSSLIQKIVYGKSWHYV